MPSLTKTLLSACAWAAPVLTVVVPHRALQSNHGTPVERTLVQLDFQENYAQATFNVPLRTSPATSRDDESLFLTLKTTAYDAPCGTSNLTLNGDYLPQAWTGDFAIGAGTYSAASALIHDENAERLPHVLDLEWDSACLHGEEEDAEDAAQVLTVTIKAINGTTLEIPSGFTVSFKQQSPPQLLRLESTPNRLAKTKEHSESWRNPPAHLRLAVPTEVQADSIATNEGQVDSPATTADGFDVEEEARQLVALQAQLDKFQKLVAAKQRAFDDRIKQGPASFKEQLRECTNITCVTKTLASGAHGALKSLCAHLRPQNSGMGSPEDRPSERVWQSVNHDQGRIQVSPEETTSPPLHEGASVGTLSAQEESSKTPQRPSPLTLTLGVVLGLLCCGGICIVIRNHCSSLRDRTDRAATREQRTNERAYRQAARRHAWRKWWGGNRQDRLRIQDYEEKRSLIQSQEALLDEAMREEIRQLRAAHGLVTDIVKQAEEGRMGSHTYPYNDNSNDYYARYTTPSPPADDNISNPPYSPLSTASTYPPTSLPELPSRPLSRTDSLPGYRSDASSDRPPAYESDEDVSEIVPNGFRPYSHSTASSTASSRWTPGSSIVDVSPRPSVDTLRYSVGEETEYAEMSDTGMGDKE